MRTGLSAIDRWVVRCPNWVGDIVMATPVFESLRLTYPRAHITACVRPYARGILTDSPWFDRIVPCNDKTLAGLRALCAALREPRPQAGLLLTNTTHSFLTFRLAGIRQLYGYRRNLRKYFLTDGPLPPPGKAAQPMQDYYLALCRHLGFTVPAQPAPRLYISPPVQQHGDELLARYGIAPTDLVIGLNPGARFGSSKCWPPEHFARLAELLQQEFACKLLLLVGPGEERIADAIVTGSRAAILNTAPDKVDLALLKPLVKRCQLLITNDTGPRHYAVAFGVPTVVLMGPTNPVYTARNLTGTIVLRQDLPCMPCHKKTCPLGHHACMRDIHPDAVIAAIKRLRATENSRPRG